MGLKIKTNSRIFFLIIISSFVWGCTNPNENLFTGKTIYFDTDKSIENFDIGAITDSTFQIIPLETTDNSLIASIDKIEIRKEDRKGTLLEKIVSGDDTYDNPIIFFYYFKK
jgi:hypothetical protein